MTISRHPEPQPVQNRFAVLSDVHAPFHSRRPLFQEEPLELVPCSPPTPLFLERSSGAYSRTDTACRFLQLLPTYGHCATTLVSSQGRRRRPSSFSDPPCLSLARAMTSGEPRYPSDLTDPGAGFFRLLGVSRPRYQPAHFPIPFRMRTRCTGPWTEQRTCPLDRE